MADHKKQVEKVLETLRSLAGHSFPLDCSCGERYTDLQDFLSRTQKKGPECGIMELGEENDPEVTQIMRDCPQCGSSLVAIFFERRNFSEDGDKVRGLFEQLHKVATTSGLQEDDARERLRDVMRGGNNQWLHQLLMDQHVGTMDELAQRLDLS